MKKSKALQEYEEELKRKYDVEDGIEQQLILKRMCEGERLFIEEQVEGPDSDVYTWVGYLGTKEGDLQRRVMGRDLKKMQARHWITYNRALNEFLLTDDGRKESEANEANSN
ncbi:MAG TPA: hypothetical protein VEM96_02580 [Pyrinomonadaceae bacterium]|nr:hypothetical protein [Pyrinomonadaceae bacterium]